MNGNPLAPQASFHKEVGFEMGFFEVAQLVSERTSLICFGPTFWHPAGLDGKKLPGIQSPIQSITRFFNSLSAGLLDRVNHAGNGLQMEGFLYCPPIRLGQQYCISPFPSDLNRFVRFICLIDQGIEIFSCLRGGDGGHE